MKKFFSLVLATLAATTMTFAAVQQVSDNVTCGTTKNLLATPKTGYHFVNWKANDVIVSTANPWENVEVTADVTYTATFAPNTHSLSWVTDGDALAGDYTHGDDVEFGTAIVAPNTPTKTGYVFDGWDAEVASTMPDADVTYTATWVPATNTKYTVKHFQQNVEDDNYTEVTEDKQELTGTTGTATAAEAKSYEGFNAKAFDQTTIAADGSAVVSIYYDRQKFTVTFMNGTETMQTIENVKYGATPAYTGAVPTKAADADNTYVFEGNWDPAVGPITGTTTYNALFTTVPKSSFLVSTAVTPDGKGHVTGGGTYKDGASVTLEAISDDSCYEFEKWDDEVTTNPRTETVTGAVTYTAIFKKYVYDIIVQSEDEDKGTVSFE